MDSLRKGHALVDEQISNYELNVQCFPTYFMKQLLIHKFSSLQKLSCTVYDLIIIVLMHVE